MTVSKIPENKGGEMDKDGCDSRRIRFSWYFTKITLWRNVVKPWTVDIFE